jgi:hypothetical protein
MANVTIYSIHGSYGTCFHHASLRFTRKPLGQVKEAKKKRAKDDASVDAVGEIFRSCPLDAVDAYGRMGVRPIFGFHRQNIETCGNSKKRYVIDAY